MISCPNCGTLNRKGSKYCSNCGQRLEIVSDIACPSCDRLNPVDSTLCWFCGASLMPSALAAEGDRGVQQPSQPQGEVIESEPESIEPTKAPRRELPSWLYQSTAQPETPSPPTAVPPSLPAQPPAEEERSKYLRGIRGVLPSADAWLLASLKRAVGEPTSDSGETTKLEPQPG